VGINWWETDPWLSADAGRRAGYRDLRAENRELRSRIRELESGEADDDGEQDEDGRGARR
ncbi:MAG: gas vesicle protein, partial [Trebonia sp.]